jgi:hypothetical protein
MAVGDITWIENYQKFIDGSTSTNTPQEGQLVNLTDSKVVYIYGYKTGSYSHHLRCMVGTKTSSGITWGSQQTIKSDSYSISVNSVSPASSNSFVVQYTQYTYSSSNECIRAIELDQDDVITVGSQYSSSYWRQKQNTIQKVGENLVAMQLEFSSGSYYYGYIRVYDTSSGGFVQVYNDNYLNSSSYTPVSPMPIAVLGENKFMASVYYSGTRYMALYDGSSGSWAKTMEYTLGRNLYAISDSKVISMTHSSSSLTYNVLTVSGSTITESSQKTLNLPYDQAEGGFKITDGALCLIRDDNSNNKHYMLPLWLDENDDLQYSYEEIHDFEYGILGEQINMPYDVDTSEFVLTYGPISYDTYYDLYSYDDGQSSFNTEYTGSGTVSASGSASTEMFGNYGTYTGSGTATLSGSAYSEISLDKEYMPSGGATLSGSSALYTEIYDYTGSGSMTLSGDATEIEENDFIGSGSILLSGEATAIVYSLGYIYTASGSGQFSGTAPVGEAVDIVYKGDPPSSFHPSRDIIVVEENSAVSSFDIDSYGDKFIHVYESVDGAYMEAQKLVPSTDDVWGETYLRRVGGSISISNTQEHAVTILNDTTAVVAHASSSGNIDAPLVQRMQIISMGGSHGVTLSTNPLVIYDNHDSRLPKLTRLDDTRFLLTYWSWGSNDSFCRLIAKVCYISGTSINVYNPYVISDEAQQHGNGPECYDVKLIDTDKVVVSYRNSSTSRGALRVCSISFASVTVGDEYEMGTGTAFSISLTKIASNEFGVMSNTGWDGFRRCQVSGTSITFGPLITDDEVKPTYNGDINYQFGKLSTFFMDSSNRGIGQSMRLVGDELKDKWIHEVLSENIEDPRIQPLDNGVLVAYYIDNADNSYLKSAIIQTRGVSEIYPGLIASGSAQPQISKDFSGSGSISLTGEAESEVLRIYEGLGNISLSGHFNFTIDVHPVVGGTISIYGLALVEKESVYNPSGNISLSGVVATEKDSYYIGGGTTVLSSQYSAQVDIIEDGFVIGFFDGSADTYPELTPIGSGEIRISGLADYTIDKVFIPSGGFEAYGAVSTVSPGGAAYTGYGKVKAIGSVGLDELHVAELGSGYVNLYGSSVATMNNEYIMLGGMSITGQSLDEVDRSVYVYGQATIYGGLIDSEVGAFYNASGSIQLQGHSPEFIEIYSYSGSGVVQASGVANIEFYTYWPTGGITLSGSFIVDVTYDSMEVVVRESYINRNIYVESSIVKDITVESITDRKFTIRSLL